MLLRKYFFLAAATWAAAALLNGATYVNGQAARAMFGSPTFTNGAGGTGPNTLGGVGGLAWSGNQLFVADSNRIASAPENNRVMIFNTLQVPGPYADPSVVAAVPSSQCYLCGFSASTVIGQKDFTTNTPGRRDVPNSSGGIFNQPTSIAVEGSIMAVADTDNNRVLIWNGIPSGPTVPPTVVLGQADFAAFQSPQLVNANSLRGPQGVWIQGGRVIVADTQNNRVLIWRRVPTTNNAPADVVVGQQSFSTNAGSPNLVNNFPATSASMLFTPTSVSSDGQRLIVSDLGANRVLIWNAIPDVVGQGADVVVGQPDMSSSRPNNRDAFCPNTGTDASGNTLPVRCEGTLNFPRAALSDGTRLYIADSGNDRVLIFNTIPSANGAKADVVLGQPDFINDVVTIPPTSLITTEIDNTSSVNTTPSPTGLAVDGTNLYVSDAYNRRVLLFTPGDVSLPSNSLVNFASEITRQEGVVTLGVTTVKANDTATITIAATGYTYTVKAGDTITTITQGLVSAINANSGDPNVTALLGSGSGVIYLSSKATNLAFDSIALAASVSSTTDLSILASGNFLTAGTGSTAAPGMLVEINAPAGVTLADQTAIISDPPSADLPSVLGGVQVFMDGRPQPLLRVTPSQVVTIVPWDFIDRNSTSVYVKAQRNDGSTTITNALAASITAANPGLFSNKSGNVQPFPAQNARHQPGNPRAIVQVDGTPKAGDVVTVTVSGRNYAYTEVSGDTLSSVVSNVVNLVNSDPQVTAEAGGAFNRVVVVARASGADGTGIAVTASTSSGATTTVTALTGSTCCNVTANAPITVDNPAQVNEVIQLDAAGLGLLTNGPQPFPGTLFNGTVPNNVSNSVNSQMAGTTPAQVIAAEIPTGSYGKYNVQLLVPAALGNNAQTTVYIAQNAFVSNLVTIPVGTPGSLTGSGTGNSSSCPRYLLSASSQAYFAAGVNGFLGVRTDDGCSWSAATDQSWITFTNSTTQTGSGTIQYQLAANTTGSTRSANLTVAGQTVTIAQSATFTPSTAALRFVPLAKPCRAIDTRFQDAPILSGQTGREFAVSNTCGVPSSVKAYALNVTVVPSSTLTYLTMWPAGIDRPNTSVLNSFDGRIKANAAIVPAGRNGFLAAYATDDTQLVLDMTGYFVAASDPTGQTFFPINPCRVLDTRNAGLSALAAGETRAVNVRGSACGLPSTATTYSLNVTALPRAPLLYLTAFPGNGTQPATSTLNAPTATVTANATLLPASTADGSIKVFTTAATDLVVDVNGYFAASAVGLNYYTSTPCRALDTRFQNTFSPIQGNFVWSIFTSGCAIPDTAQAYAMNVTVVPPAPFQYLTLWDGGVSPFVSTLNAFDGAVMSNLAIVSPAGGAVEAYASDATHLIYDLFGYFAP